MYECVFSFFLVFTTSMCACLSFLSLSTLVYMGHLLFFFSLSLFGPSELLKFSHSSFFSVVFLFCAIIKKMHDVIFFFVLCHLTLKQKIYLKSPSYFFLCSLHFPFSVCVYPGINRVRFCLIN
jgi:hypothetical protein